VKIDTEHGKVIDMLTEDPVDKLIDRLLRPPEGTALHAFWKVCEKIAAKEAAERKPVEHRWVSKP